MMRSTFRRAEHSMTRRLLTACVLGLTCLAGCDSGDRAGFDPTWVLDEHGKPDFEPEDFEDAIKELKSRFGDVAAQPAPETSPPAAKFRQIVRWLPKFAADTPIRRAGWDELAQRCSRMEEAARQPGFFATDRIDTFRGEIDAIAALVPPDTLYRKLDAHTKPDPTKPGEGETGSGHGHADEAGHDTDTNTGEKATEPKGNDR